MPFWLVILAFGLTFASGQGNGTLPVFRVKSSYAGESRAVKLMQNIFGQTDHTSSHEGSRFLVQVPDNSIVVEHDLISGGLWVADHTQLWNISRRPNLPNEDEAQNIANGHVAKYGLLPNLTGPFSFIFGGFSGTQLGREVTVNQEKGLYDRQNFQLDISVNYHARFQIPGVADPIPFVGGGGNFQVTLGDEGRLIGFHGTWRDVDSQGVHYKVIPQKEADQAFLNKTKELEVISFNSTLAYYSAPAQQVQNFIFPVYIYHATAKFGNQTVELRDTIFPASEFGIETYNGCQTGRKTATQRNPEPGNSTGPGNFTSPRVRRRDDDSTWELGTEWLGQPWGLSQTQANANGFRDIMVSDGAASWSSAFDWGDHLVWESDWDAHDDTWVDAVDFMFYTGHANGNGWVTDVPDSTFVSYSIVGGFPEVGGDRWGSLDLEWLVIAACGPHQDDRIVAGGGNAFDRWRGAFEGMHTFLGYATVTYDTDQEGRRLATYAQQGKTIIQSWFQTAKEVQNSGVWVTAMWADTDGNDIGQDHLPGHGFRGEDPLVGLPGGQSRWLMWSMV